MTNPFPHLFSPVELGSLTLKNRIFVPGHGTRYARDYGISDDLVAYHEARAAGGVGLIITEVCSVHHTYDPPNRISLTHDKHIPGVTRLANMCHGYDCAFMMQLFHPGRVPAQSPDGSRPVAYAPSEVPDEKYRYQPFPLPNEMVWEFVQAHGDAARRACEGGADGVEIIASMGYLVPQFLNPRLNLRTDEFGGDFDGRLRFLREIIADIRAKTDDRFVVGIRISIDEMDHEGLTPEEVLPVCQALDSDGLLDFFDIISGTVSSVAGWTQVVPPMFVEPGYLATHARTVKDVVSKPVMVAARINQPQIAEQILERGDADLCGMVRANICDPEFANKAKEDRAEDIRACIGCNQACIGHGAGEFGISCIQRPETGRERAYGKRIPAAPIRKVMVVGGGPAGMKVAAVAGERGHQVTLYEKSERLGGQALLAQLLPGRTEFGGIVGNLTRELELAGVEVVKRTEVNVEQVKDIAPDVVVLATGAEPGMPLIEGADEAHIVDAWAVVKDEANVGANVVIADWRCDWIGLGVAEKLARAGCHVRLAVNGAVPGEGIHFITRDTWIGKLHELGVTMIPFARLFGADGDSVYLQHTVSQQPMVLEEVDTVVTVQANRRSAALADALGAQSDIETHLIGDCLSPRTAEEAVLEGLKVGALL